MISLELKDICKSFGSRNVLSGISFSIDSGCLVVTGPNGSGKSTLLRIISGLTAATSGHVILTEGSEELPSSCKRDVIGLAGPDIKLYDELSALENLQFFAKLRGIVRTDDQLLGSLSKLGLDGRQYDRLASFSSGMKQRVKFAFALQHDPAILLLDEPSSNLDDPGRSLLDTIIADQRERGIVIIATNDKSELNYGDRVLDLGSSGLWRLQ